MMEQDKITTKWWEVLILWKDGSTDWIQLKDKKDSNPVEVAEYAVANHIQDKPEFSWWDPKLLRWRNLIISKVKSKYWRETIKFGTHLPKTIEEALWFDKEAGNYYWERALNK